MAESKKSLYKPKFPKKYKGDISNIICRSSWENKFCSWCDLNAVSYTHLTLPTKRIV